MTRATFSKAYGMRYWLRDCGGRKMVLEMGDFFRHSS